MQNHPVQARTHHGETAVTEPTPISDIVFEEEQRENESESCMLETQTNNEWEHPEASDLDREVQETQSDTQEKVRRSTKCRCPGQTVTYTLLDQLTWQPCFMVCPIGTQPTVYTVEFGIGKLMTGEFVMTFFCLFCMMLRLQSYCEKKLWIVLIIASVKSNFCLLGSVWCT